MQKIVTLYLGNNHIKAAGAKRLTDSLRYNKVIYFRTAFLLYSISFHTQTLATLDLWSNQIGTTGAQNFADVLRNNTVCFVIFVVSYIPISSFI